VLPLLKWNKLIPRIEAERLRWIQLKNEYEDLWTDAKANGEWIGAQKELRKLRKKDNDAERSGGIIPEHGDLLDKARRDVIMARGGAVYLVIYGLLAAFNYSTARFKSCFSIGQKQFRTLWAPILNRQRLHLQRSTSFGIPRLV
jgi:hypothetical protein